MKQEREQIKWKGTVKKGKGNINGNKGGRGKEKRRDRK